MGTSVFTQAHIHGTLSLFFDILMCNLHIPINDLDAGLEGVLRKFADDMGLGAAPRQGWLGNHQPCKFNKDKCWVLHLAWGNPGCVHRMGNERLESSPVERDLGAMVDGKLNMIQQEDVSGEV